MHVSERCLAGTHHVVPSWQSGAGLVVEESRYLCVRLRNERRKLTMDRVYIHAVLRKPAGAGTPPQTARPNPDLCDGNVLRCVPAWCAMLAGRKSNP